MGVDLHSGVRKGTTHTIFPRVQCTLPTQTASLNDVLSIIIVQNNWHRTCANGMPNCQFLHYHHINAQLFVFLKYNYVFWFLKYQVNCPTSKVFQPDFKRRMIWAWQDWCIYSTNFWTSWVSYIIGVIFPLARFFFQLFFYPYYGIF